MNRQDVLRREHERKKAQWEARGAPMIGEASRALPSVPKPARGPSGIRWGHPALALSCIVACIAAGWIVWPYIPLPGRGADEGRDRATMTTPLRGFPPHDPYVPPGRSYQLIGEEMNVVVGYAPSIVTPEHMDRYTFMIPETGRYRADLVLAVEDPSIFEQFHLEVRWGFGAYNANDPARITALGSGRVMKRVAEGRTLRQEFEASKGDHVMLVYHAVTQLREMGIPYAELPAPLLSATLMIFRYEPPGSAPLVVPRDAPAAEEELLAWMDIHNRMFVTEHAPPAEVDAVRRVVQERYAGRYTFLGVMGGVRYRQDGPLRTSSLDVVFALSGDTTQPYKNRNLLLVSVRFDASGRALQSPAETLDLIENSRRLYGGPYESVDSVLHTIWVRINAHLHDRKPLQANPIIPRPPAAEFRQQMGWM